MDVFHDIVLCAQDIIDQLERSHVQTTEAGRRLCRIAYSAFNTTLTNQQRQSNTVAYILDLLKKDMTQSGGEVTHLFGILLLTFYMLDLFDLEAHGEITVCNELKQVYLLVCNTTSTMEDGFGIGLYVSPHEEVTASILYSCLGKIAPLCVSIAKNTSTNKRTRIL